MSSMAGASDTAASASTGAPGMVIYRDPATGELGAPPATPQPETGSALSSFNTTSVTEWHEEPNSHPGGGWRLNGPMLTSFTVTRDTDGKLHGDCATATPGNR